MKPLKITFLSPVINMGGGTKVMCIYAEELMRMGHSVTIVSTPLPSVSTTRKLINLVKGRESPTPNLSHIEGRCINHHTIDSPRPIVDSDVPDGDVVIATWWETAEWVGTLSPSKGKKAYFIQHHEVFPHLPERSRETYRLPMKKIVIAKWLKDVMATEYGDTDVDLIPNSVDRTQFYSQARNKQITPTVGVLFASVDFKGVDVSSAAIDIVRRYIPKLRVVSFGSERPTRSLPLPYGAEFHLRPSVEKIRDIYSSCDLWLTASRSEGFNLPALEAMACGTPVVSTKAGWPAEGVIDGFNGQLSEIDDVKGLANAMHEILRLPDGDWATMSANASQTMTTASWAESAKLLERSLITLCLRG